MPNVREADKNRLTTVDTDTRIGIHNDKNRNRQADRQVDRQADR